MEITACDVSDERVQLIRENGGRLGLNSIRTLCIARDGAGIPDEVWDAALVDAPCSNTGVLARRPEARWRFRESSLEGLTRLQTRLLMMAFDRVRVGGRVVYSTCSIEPEETTRLVRSLADAVPAMELSCDSLLQPGQPADGGYTALLRRTGATGRRQRDDGAGMTV